MTRYVLRPRAERDIDEIWKFGVGAWGRDRATLYVRQIQSALEIIASDPLLGRACDGIRAGYRRHASGTHMIFYRADDEGVEVIRILHASMDVARHL